MLLFCWWDFWSWYAVVVGIQWWISLPLHMKAQEAKFVTVCRGTHVHISSSYIFVSSGVDAFFFWGLLKSGAEVTVFIPEVIGTISIGEHTFGNFLFLNLVIHWFQSLPYFHWRHKNMRTGKKCGKYSYNNYEPGGMICYTHYQVHWLFAWNWHWIHQLMVATFWGWNETLPQLALLKWSQILAWSKMKGSIES